MGFLFNGEHSDDYNLIVKTKRQILAGLDDRYVEIPGRDGSYLVPGKAKDKIFALKCYVEFDDLANLRQKTKDIAAWLYTDARTNLIFDDEPAMIYKAKLDGAINFETTLGYGEFDIAFRTEPFAYGAEVQQNLNANNVVVRVGTAPALPTITAVFSSAASEYKILHADSGKYVRVVHSFVAGDTLLIEHNVNRVALNGVVIMSSLDIASEFFSLDRVSNTFIITPTGVATTTLAYNQRWL